MKMVKEQNIYPTCDKLIFNCFYLFSCQKKVWYILSKYIRHLHTFHNTPCLSTKILLNLVFHFSWVLQPSQEKLKNCSCTNKVHFGKCASGECNCWIRNQGEDNEKRTCCELREGAHKRWSLNAVLTVIKGNYSGDFGKWLLNWLHCRTNLEVRQMQYLQVVLFHQDSVL